MRILDETSDRAIKRVTIFLTVDEAKSLANQLGKLLAKPSTHHIHIEDEAFETEVTLAVYTRSSIDQFDERSRQLIERDE